MEINNQATSHIKHDIGIASQIGSYSDAVEVGAGYRWLYTSGTPGLSAQRELPDDITRQTEIAWQHTLKLLNEANMTVRDIVKITQYLTRTEDIPAYSKVRRGYLGDAKPASTLLITPQLGWPGMLVEVEIIAAKKG
jgi:2-iminobutanoate/2-iminopropanoate deaminase